MLAILGYRGESFERRLGEADISRDEDPDLEQLRTVRDQFDLARIEALLVFDSDDVLTPANIRAIRAAQRAVAQLPQIALFSLGRKPVHAVRRRFRYPRSVYSRWPLRPR